MDLRVGRRAGNRTHRLFGLPQGAAAPVSAVGGAPVPEHPVLERAGKGGHFAAFEQPALSVDEVRSFFRLVR
jgi:hypothetical protein